MFELRYNTSKSLLWGLAPEEQKTIEDTLDQYGVQTFEGFDFWSFERGGDFIAVRRVSWEFPRFERSIDALFNFCTIITNPINQQDKNT